MPKKDPLPPEADRQPPRRKNGVYEIRIRGVLDDHWRPWFEGMRLGHGMENGEACTILTGPVVDQPALHGLLAKIGDLNLTLISVREVQAEGGESSENQDLTDG